MKNKNKSIMGTTKQTLNKYKLVVNALLNNPSMSYYAARKQGIKIRKQDFFLIKRLILFKELTDAQRKELNRLYKKKEFKDVYKSFFQNRLLNYCIQNQLSIYKARRLGLKINTKKYYDLMFKKTAKLIKLLLINKRHSQKNPKEAISVFKFQNTPLFKFFYPKGKLLEEVLKLWYSNDLAYINRLYTYYLNNIKFKYPNLKFEGYVVFEFYHPKTGEIITLDFNYFYTDLTPMEFLNNYINEVRNLFFRATKKSGLKLKNVYYYVYCFNDIYIKNEKFKVV